MVPDLGSSRGEGNQSRRFCPGNVQERLARGMQQMTGLVIRYKVIKETWLLSGEDLVG